MSTKKFLALVGRLEAELKEMKQIVYRVECAWEKALDSAEDSSFFLDSVALNLHSFYAGIEKIFEHIAVNIDSFRPKTDSWHQELLKQMATELPEIRPAVISQGIKVKLDEYRAFRHLVRNVYTINLKPEKLKILVDSLPVLLEELESELKAFTNYLKE